MTRHHRWWIFCWSVDNGAPLYWYWFSAKFGALILQIAWKPGLSRYKDFSEQDEGIR